MALTDGEGMNTTMMGKQWMGWKWIRRWIQRRVSLARKRTAEYHDQYQ